MVLAMIIGTTMEFPKLQTIEEYLSLKDWSYVPYVTEGIHSEYYWVASDRSFVDEFEKLELPEGPIRVLATSFDGTGGTAMIYSDEPGWKALGEFAISEPVTKQPKMYFVADHSFMLIDRPLTDEQLLEGLSDFNDFSPLYMETEKFWRSVDMLQPRCYFADLHHSIFAARGIQLYQQVFNQSYLDRSVELQRQDELKGRKQRWEAQGPERGPETCVEQGCTRLRIQLTIRCFIHTFPGNVVD